MAFLHLFIINKSGGLIYNRELSSIAPLIDVNILLSIGSTFHSLCSIAVEACPVKKNKGSSNDGSGGVGGNNNSAVGGSSSLSASMVANSAHNISNSAAAGNSIIGGLGEMDDGIEFIEGDGIVLCCYQTRTGVKFVITAEPGTRGLKQILKEIYVLYADCTLKDPFYELEMPIRCDLFTQAVEDLIQNFDESNSMMYGSNSGIGGGSSGVRNNDPIVKLR